MRLSDGVEWAVHCCTVLAFVPDEAPGVPAAKLAEFHGVPPAYLAKAMQALVRAGVCTSIPGPKGGFKLARPAAEITVLDVALAVDGDEPAFTCQEIRRRGPGGGGPDRYPAPCGIARTFWAAEDAWRRSLRAVTIADLVAELGRSVHPQQLAEGAVWLQEVLIR